MRQYINIVREGFDLHLQNPEAGNRYDKLLHSLIAAYEVYAQRQPEDYAHEDAQSHAEFFLNHLTGDGAHHLDVQAPERMVLKRLGIEADPMAILNWIEGPQVVDAVLPQTGPAAAVVPAVAPIAPVVPPITM